MTKQSVTDSKHKWANSGRDYLQKCAVVEEAGPASGNHLSLILREKGRETCHKQSPERREGQPESRAAL
jgi:hypothetical protein